mmetsp:Transcript_6123/g.9542  ORF Transcript_6123/g.9542 Transcript_6123/m.9542 type:complete len:98 (+) Transcript_6123:46-339(+)
MENLDQYSQQFSQLSNEQQHQANMAALMFQLNIQNDLFRRLRDSCYRKCIRQYREGDLTVGEGACLERCVAKFMEAYTLVGARVFGGASVSQAPQNS